jgi:hypothetical protein
VLKVVSKPFASALETPGVEETLKLNDQVVLGADHVVTGAPLENIPELLTVKVPARLGGCTTNPALATRTARTNMRMVSVLQYQFEMYHVAHADSMFPLDILSI